MTGITVRHVIARLTLGPITQEEEEYWYELNRTVEAVERHFRETGLTLHLAPEWGVAWLTQEDTDDETPDARPIPRLLRADKMPYHASILLALLREKFAEHRQQFDTGDSLAELILCSREMTALMTPYLPATTNEAKLEKQAQEAANKLEKIGILARDRNRDGDGWRVRPVIQAKLTTQVAAELRERLAACATEPTTPDAPAPTDH